MQDAVTPLSELEAVDLVKTVFASATERDIYTVSFPVQFLSLGECRCLRNACTICNLICLRHTR